MYDFILNMWIEGRINEKFIEYQISKKRINKKQAEFILKQKQNNS